MAFLKETKEHLDADTHQSMEAMLEVMEVCHHEFYPDMEKESRQHLCQHMFKRLWGVGLQDMMLRKAKRDWLLPDGQLKPKYAHLINKKTGKAQWARIDRIYAEVPRCKSHVHLVNSQKQVQIDLPISGAVQHYIDVTFCYRFDELPEGCTLPPDMPECKSSAVLMTNSRAERIQLKHVDRVLYDNVTDIQSGWMYDVSQNRIVSDKS